MTQQVVELRFDGTKAEALAEMARTADTRIPTYNQLYDPELRYDGEKPGPGDSPSRDEIDPSKLDPALHLVKDEGIYLMSNSKNQPEARRDRVVYAEGFDPAHIDQGALHERCRRAVGGDDFVQAIPTEWVMARPEEEVFVLRAKTENRRFVGVETDMLESI